MGQDTSERKGSRGPAPRDGESGPSAPYSLAAALSATALPDGVAPPQLPVPPISATGTITGPVKGPPPLQQPAKAPVVPAPPASTRTAITSPAKSPVNAGGDDDGANAGGSSQLSQNSGRRPAKRRPAGPARTTIAANDDIPTIGALIYALEQKPSRQPFKVAAVASTIWAVMGLAFGGVMLASEIAKTASFWELLAQPALLTMAATILLPVAIFYFLAMLVWRAQELKLMSSAMTEVAVRLAEPDRSAEQSVTSLGQAVRKQVNFMNEAVERAIGRAGELEAMVHSEVTSLERSFQDNETRIRGVLAELASERTQLVSTSTDVHATLRAMGDEVPALIEKLNGQQGKLARIIESAGQNLIALEGSLAKASDKLEVTAIAASDKIEGTLSDRTTHLQQVLDEYTVAINTALSNRTGQMQTVFDESIRLSTQSIDGVIADKVLALSNAMDNHARQLSITLSQQSRDIDDNLMHGIDAVRRSSENITKQSVKAVEGLSGQADMLRNVSENLLTQIGSVTNRFENQGQSIMRAANALETANFRIDSTLQQRHSDMNETLQKLTGKATELDAVMQGYSTNLEGSMSAAESRARSLTQDLSRTAETHTRATLADLERMRLETEAQASRTLSDMQTQFSTVGREMTSQMGTLSSRLTETSEDLRLRTQRASADLMAEHERLRAEAERLPDATRESTDTMRRVLQEQIRALDQLSNLSNREALRRDVMPPAPLSIGRSGGSLPATGYPQSGPRAGQNHWSLGDLLARASVGSGADAGQRPSVAAHPDQGGGGAPINLDVIASALDADTAAAIWSRYRAGQRGIMVRSIYSADGRNTFDEVSRRYAGEPSFRATVDTFLGDFERLLQESELRDASGRTVESHLASASGRTYLFLAHAAGRLS